LQQKKDWATLFTNSSGHPDSNASVALTEFKQKPNYILPKIGVVGKKTNLF
jgi:hypothetical protein